eukprot:10129475-Karenia_brevis.AAC.1
MKTVRPGHFSQYWPVLSKKYSSRLHVRTKDWLKCRGNEVRTHRGAACSQRSWLKCRPQRGAH